MPYRFLYRDAEPDDRFGGHGNHPNQQPMPAQVPCRRVVKVVLVLVLIGNNLGDRVHRMLSQQAGDYAQGIATGAAQQVAGAARLPPAGEFGREDRSVSALVFQEGIQTATWLAAVKRAISTWPR